MIDALIAGKLLGDPEQRSGKAQSQFVVAKLRASAGDGELLIVNVIAFDDAPSKALLGLRDGDSVALSGSLTPKAWTDKQGNVKPALDLVAQRVLSAYPL
jgi:single-stranded DNA-binding protein